MKEINFYILNSNNEVVMPLSTSTVGEHIPVLRANVESKLNSYDLLELVVPADYAGVELIKEDHTVVFEDIDGWREYIITSYEDVDGSNIERTITAELSSIELLDDVILNELQTNSTDPEDVLREVLAGTRWGVGYVDSSLYNRSFGSSIKYKNVLEVIDMLSSFYSAEISFSYVISGNKVARRLVNMYKQIGTNRGKWFEVDKDVTEVSRTVDISDIKTAIIPYSTENSETGERFDISSVEWKVANGDPVDKPKGQLWLEDKTALELWGRVDTNGNKRQRFITMEFDVETPEQVASMAWVQLGRYSKPKVTYEGNVIDLYALTGDEDLKHEAVHLGDWAVITDRYFAEPLAIQTRIVEVRRNLLDPIDNEVVLGDSKQFFKAKDTVDTVEDRISQLENKIKGTPLDTKEIQEMISGKNTIYYGSDNPVSPISGDIWFMPHPLVTGETILRYFNGTLWVDELDSSRTKDVEEAVRQAENSTAEAKRRAEEAYKKGEDALGVGNQALSGLDSKLDSGTYSADKQALERDIAGKLGKKVDITSYEAEKLALESELSGKVDTITYNADKASIEQEMAYKVAQETYNAKVSEIDTAISGHETRIEEAEGTLKLTAKATDVDSLKGRMSTAEGSITANSKAIALKASQETVDAVEGRLESAESALTIQADEIASKVSTTDFNAVKGRLSTAESNISQQAEEIASKVSTTTYNALNKRVGTAEATIKQHADAIESKVSTTDFNAVKGRLSTAESTITQHATAIESKVSTKDFDAVDGRLSTAETTISQHATQLQSKVSTKDFDAVEGRLGTAESTITQHATAIASKVSSTDFNKVEGRLKTAESTITQHAGMIASKVSQTDHDTLTGRVGTAESTLTQHASQIASKVSQTDFNKVDGRLKTAESTLTQHANSISSKVSQTDFNKVEGRVKTAEATITQQGNLINSKVSTTDFNALGGRVDTAESNITQMSENINLRVEKNDVVNQINVSTEGILIDGKKIHLTGQTTIDNGIITNAMIKNLSADKINAGTINGSNINVINLNASNITGGNLDVKKIKIMNGTTEVLSVNGTTGQVSMNVNSLKINAKGVATEEFAQSQASSAETRAKSHADSKATTAETNAKNHANSVASSAETRAKSHADSKASTAETNAKNHADKVVNDLEVGVKNLVLGSGIRKDTTEYMVGEWFLSEDFIEGETYTVSLKGTKSDSVSFGLWQNTGSTGKGNLTHVGDGIYALTFKSSATTAGNERRMRIYQPPSGGNGTTPATIEWIKLEKGTKATGYIPAPEDLEESISSKADASALNEVSETASTARLLAESAVNQDDYSRFLEQYEAYKQAVVEESAEATKTLSDAVGRIATVETELGENAEKWTFIDSAIQMSEEGILIQNNAQDLALLIANDRISFYDGYEVDDKGNVTGTEVAFITGKTMQINHGIFVESAQIGAHLISSLPENEDITTVSWVGRR